MADRYGMSNREWAVWVGFAAVMIVFMVILVAVAIAYGTVHTDAPVGSPTRA